MTEHLTARRTRAAGSTTNSRPRPGVPVNGLTTQSSSITKRKFVPHRRPGSHLPQPAAALSCPPRHHARRLDHINLASDGHHRRCFARPARYARHRAVGIRWQRGNGRVARHHIGRCRPRPLRRARPLPPPRLFHGQPRRRPARRRHPARGSTFIEQPTQAHRISQTFFLYFCKTRQPL